MLNAICILHFAFCISYVATLLAHWRIHDRSSRDPFLPTLKNVVALDPIAVTGFHDEGDFRQRTVQDVQQL
jgi:phage-related holin